MGAKSRLSDLRTKYANANGLLRQRPFFVPAREWDLFAAFVWGGKEIGQLAIENGVAVKAIRRILAGVERNLEIPRASEREWRGLTPASPVEDLDIPVRALNRLRDLRCSTVADVLRMDLDRSRIGERSREEVVAQLQRSGLRPAVMNSRKPELARVTAQLLNLQEQVSQSTRSWKNRLERMEARLRRFVHEEG